MGWPASGTRESPPPLRRLDAMAVSWQKSHVSWLSLELESCVRQPPFGAEAAAPISSLLSSSAGRGRVRWPRAGASYLMWARRPWVFYIKTSVKSQTFRNHYLPNFVKFSKGRQESARPSQLTSPAAAATRHSASAQGSARNTPHGCPCCASALRTPLLAGPCCPAS